MNPRTLTLLTFTSSLYWTTIFAVMPTKHVQFITTFEQGCALLATQDNFKYDCNYATNAKQNYNFELIVASTDSEPFYSVKSELTGMYLCCVGIPYTPCTAS